MESRTRIDDDRFTQVVNTQSTPKPISGPASKTSTSEPRIVDLASEWDKIKAMKTKQLRERAERYG